MARICHHVASDDMSAAAQAAQAWMEKARAGDDAEYGIVEKLDFVGN
jgi:hypothetical protein